MQTIDEISASAFCSANRMRLVDEATQQGIWFVDENGRVLASIDSLVS